MSSRDTQEFEAKKDFALEVVAVVMVLLMAAVIGAIFVMGADKELEKHNGRVEHSTDSR